MPQRWTSMSPVSRRTGAEGNGPPTLNMYIDCTGTGRLKPSSSRTSAATRGERENSRNTGSRACRAVAARARAAAACCFIQCSSPVLLRQEGQPVILCAHGHDPGCSPPAPSTSMT